MGYCYFTCCSISSSSTHLLIINIPCHSLYFVSNLAFPIYALLVMLCISYIIPLAKMGRQLRLGIYIDFNSLSIIRYLEPLTSDLFTAHLADCHFDEIIFPSLKNEKSLEVRYEFSWKVPILFHLDSRTNQCENEV